MEPPALQLQPSMKYPSFNIIVTCVILLMGLTTSLSEVSARDIQSTTDALGTMQGSQEKRTNLWKQSRGKGRGQRTGRRYTPHDEEDEEFCYTRPQCGPDSDQWEGLCQEGRRQSPIDIQRQRVILSEWGGPVYLNPDYRNLQNFLLMNSGHTVSAMLNSDLSSRASIRVDGSKKLMHGATHIFAQVHFHWGSHGEIGSEHTLDGQRFAMEGHFVHYNAKYENFTEAMEQRDGLAIFAVFFEETLDDNAALDPIVDLLEKVRTSRKMFQGSGLDLTSLIPVMSRSPKNAYHYYGSLTTPECIESVTWIVFEQRLGVSRRQLEAFRSLIDSNGDRMQDNFRPTQPLNNRKVRKISVFCGDHCRENDLQVHPSANVVGHRIGKSHFPFILIGPKLKNHTNPLELALSFINISMYLVTIFWLISLIKNNNNNVL